VSTKIFVVTQNLFSVDARFLPFDSDRACE
jgi:hypothetical protein